MDVSGYAAPPEPLKNAVLIAGPTASGKSALALRIACDSGATIVNADSMQVYSVLNVLTARPREADLALAPHRLYGHVHPRDAYSTGRWVRDVEELIRSGDTKGPPLVFVGGTGLYFRALLEGLSEMPPVDEGVRRRWREALGCEGPAALHRLLAESDPQSAATIRPGDGQRIVRALEVLEASGRPISHWQKVAGRPLVDRAAARLILLEPERTELKRRIDARFDTMIGEGAVEEARALNALGLDASMPAMKAIGVRELIAADRGEMTLAEAVERAKTSTRQYSKRQATWFRNQLGPGWERLSHLRDGAGG